MQYMCTRETLSENTFIFSKHILMDNLMHCICVDIYMMWISRRQGVYSLLQKMTRCGWELISPITPHIPCKPVY